MLANGLINTAWQMCMVTFDTTKKLPQSFEEFAVGLENAATGTLNVNISPALTGADLEFIAKQIKADVHGPWSVMYKKADGVEGSTMPMHMNPVPQHYYPLIHTTLCDDGSKRNNKRVKISVIALWPFGDDLMKQRVVQTTLERLERWVPDSGGKQNSPCTSIIIDEAHQSMPNSG